MKWIIDRFEGDIAVCEIALDTFINVPRYALPENAREGDVILLSIDADETRKRTDNINRLMNDLFAD